ncbi:MAG: heme exporter protein CcmD [Rhodospirillales bacterium]|nr:heme exporter protein CcmD [Rhodospirillales bacterium]MDE0710698.1 heme exporter protein CcmD [Rhodospirillales bacterium]
MPELSAFLAMGGYGAYVWSAYTITGLILALLVAASLRARRSMRASLDEAEQASPRRRTR